jgi:hypothetical protein
MSQNGENYNKNLNKIDNLQNQIYSMLKGVGAIEDNELEFQENINDIKENLFRDDDYSIEDTDDVETNHNTTISQQGNFLRNQNEKSLTINMKSMMYKNEFRREKKFQTQNYYSNYSFNPNFQNNNLNDNINFQLPNNYMIYNKLNNNTYNYINQNNTNPIININNNNINNINSIINNINIPLTSTPFGMKMPIRTFNFKAKHHKNNSNNILNLRHNLGNNIKYVQSPFYYNTKNEKLEKNSNNNNKIIIDNTSRELEIMLIQYGGFTKEIFNKLQGKFIPLMKTQTTSRILQYYLENTSQEIIHLIFLEIKDNIEELLFDIYANYFCLKIFYFLIEEDRIIFLKKISNNLDNLSINKISTYPIQCIIENLNYEEEQKIIFNGIINHLMKLSIDVYGTHVLEKILSSFNYDKYLIHISNFILENFVFLVNNSNGLCIVKKEILLEYKNKNDNFKELKQLIIENSLILIQNPFGNYALQMAIDNWEINDLQEIFSTFKGRYVFLSIQKYSSNVIERCIEKSEEFLTNFIYEISNDNNSIKLLMKNNYGNYVIQTALKVSKNKIQIQKTLIEILNKNLKILNDKKLINKWKSIISNNQ